MISIPLDKNNSTTVLSENLDTAFIDLNEDGIIEAIMFDENENKYFEILTVDEDLNGSPDLLYVDLDEDGNTPLVRAAKVQFTV